VKLLLYGSRSFSSTVAFLAKDCGYSVGGMVDDHHLGDLVLGTLDRVRQERSPVDYKFALAIGYSDLKARWLAAARVLDGGYACPPLIHPRAYVAPSAQIGTGTMVMAGAIVDCNAQVGDFSVVWPGACINHDAIIGHNVFISPNAVVCGFASIGSHSFIGAGAAIVDYGHVPEGSFLKMLTSFRERSR
jgi:sugar O-acyltransferase (sialic acid O-acetyltransferase NeuD family)